MTLGNKVMIISSAVLIIIPYFTWKCLYYSYKQLRKQREEKALFYRRHNCVITFQPGKGLKGWPPYEERISANKEGKIQIEILFEPILYFIKTANDSLDLAVMLINVKIIYLELIKARKRGVRIRLILNFHHAQSYLKEIRKLLSEGVEVQFYISPSSELDSIMHYKYIIKDYSEETGYVCTGSLNFSVSAFVNNYEDFVFIGRQAVAECFQKNFQECWECIKIDNTSLVNRTLLKELRLVKF